MHLVRRGDWCHSCVCVSSTELEAARVQPSVALQEEASNTSIAILSTKTEMFKRWDHTSRDANMLVVLSTSLHEYSVLAVSLHCDLNYPLVKFCEWILHGCETIPLAKIIPPTDWQGEKNASCTRVNRNNLNWVTLICSLKEIRARAVKSGGATTS